MTEEKTIIYDKRAETPVAPAPQIDASADAAAPPLPDPWEDLYKFDEIAEAFRRKSEQIPEETGTRSGASEGAEIPIANEYTSEPAQIGAYEFLKPIGAPEAEQAADPVFTPVASVYELEALVPASSAPAEAAPVAAPEEIVPAASVDEHIAQRREQRRIQEQRRDRRKSGARSTKAEGGKNSGNGGNGGGKKGNRKPQSLAKRIIKGVLAGILVAVIAAVCLVAVWVFSVIKDLPRHDPAQIQASLTQMSTIYDDQGKEMKDIYIADAYRKIVTFDQIPDNMINAIVSIEDKTFWTNNGFNVIRIIGAVRDSVFGGGDIAGTSTITQQLARNIWLTDIKSERTLDRKIKEAFYARELTNALPKQDIITAYLNTISFGNHSYGVGAAAKSYFNKDIKDLDLIECAALAALPQSPTTYSMISTVPVGDVSPTDPRVLLVTDQYIYLYNDKAEPRIRLILDLMLQQGYITKEEHDQAMNENIRDHLHPTPIDSKSNANYFINYLISNVASDLLAAYPGQLANMDEAIQMVYSKGLEIHSTFSQRLQDICTQAFEDPANYPGTNMPTDRAGNCVNERGGIILYAYGNMFEDRDDGPWFTMRPDEYELRDDGSMIIKRGGRFNIYNTTNPDGSKSISLEFKYFYTKPDDVLHIANGGTVSIPDAYKGMDADGNLIISAKFFQSPDNIFTAGDGGTYAIGPTHFSLRPSVIQPQGASVIIDHTNGQVKAMVGGRGTTDQMAYNRADNPHSPGSTMKPLGAYGPALEMSAEGAQVGDAGTNRDDNSNFGTFWTALSIIDDAPMQYQGKDWPSNWYSGNRGPQTLRNAVQQSINVCAVKVQLAVGNQRSVDFLKKLGVTTIVENGNSNDMGPASLALGGMTQGIKPVEIASAYGTFANLGVHITPITYTSVSDRNGNVVLDGKPKSTEAMDPGAAYIMNDILNTTVMNGIAKAAQVKDVPVAGKTGTNEKRNYDVWFVGNTPQYSMSVWFGCDQKVPMTQNSTAAAQMFSKIMTQVYSGMDPGSFPKQPDNVESKTVNGMTDIFLTGTAPDKLPGAEEVDVCNDSGYLATPWCPNHGPRKFLNLNSLTAISADQMSQQKAPTYYCNQHNLDPGQFPIDPNTQLNTDFGKSTVPDLVGKTVKGAQKALTKAGLVVGQIFEAYSDYASGTVLSQNPQPGEKLDKGSAVNFTVSKGPDPASNPEQPPPPEQQTIVPSLTGLTIPEATDTLLALHLALGAVKVAHAYDGNYQPGNVLSCDPAPGTAVKYGTKVTIYVNPDGP